MRSWNDNDYGFDGELAKEFKMVSTDHYHAMCDAVVAATNDSAWPPAPGRPHGRSKEH